MNSGKRILILNGSLRGAAGNCAAVAEHAASLLSRDGIPAAVLTLADPMPAIDAFLQMLLQVDGFLVVSGVYWNSWASPLQRFLEVATAFENAPAFFGKPIAVAVTMDSVGGADVAARLHASFAGLGCWSPPCSTLVISRLAEEAVARSQGAAGDPNEDVWRLADLEVVLRNLVTASDMQGNWQAWEKHTLELGQGAWPATGPLDLGSPRFL